jgi:hypothetical protein
MQGAVRGQIRWNLTSEANSCEVARFRFPKTRVEVRAIPAVFRDLTQRGSGSYRSITVTTTVTMTTI